MQIGRWFPTRGSASVDQRAMSLLGRYGLTSAKAQKRIEAAMALPGRYGCAPTLPGPGGRPVCAFHPPEPASGRAREILGSIIRHSLAFVCRAIGELFYGSFG